MNVHPGGNDRKKHCYDVRRTPGVSGDFSQPFRGPRVSNVADPAQLALRSVAALVRPSVVLIENRFLRPVVTGGETEDTCDGSTHGH